MQSKGGTFESECVKVQMIPRKTCHVLIYFFIFYPPKKYPRFDAKFQWLKE